MRLGTKLILGLVTTLITTMAVHGYLSIKQDRENFRREMRVGMFALSRSIEAALQYIYGDKKDPQSTLTFINGVAPAGNIHGIVVYDRASKRISLSASLKAAGDRPDLDPEPILKIDPRPVLTNGKATEGYIETPAYPIYYRVEPILDSSNRLVGAFVLGRRGAGLAQSIASRRNRILVTTSSLIFFFGVLILVVVRRNVSRPIRKLIDGVREIGQGRWEKRIEIKGRDEISSLAAEFNQLCARLQETYSRLIKEQQERSALETNLRQSEKLASVGQLAAGLAHEIGTPLSIIGGRAEYLLRRPRSQQELVENLEIIRSQMDRIAGIVRQLLEFSRRREPARRTVNLSLLVKKVQNLLDHKIDDKRITVQAAGLDSLPPIQADPDLLQQVFINLFLNSLHALDDGGRISIGGDVMPNAIDESGFSQRANGLRIVFEDSGSGISPEVIDQIFDPFFTTKDVGEGTGLGLSISYGIVKEHGGEIRVESEPGQFTRFIIFLPQETTGRAAGDGAEARLQ